MEVDTKNQDIHDFHVNMLNVMWLIMK
jgi:hypothetical protein